jgi:putrescine importer
MTNNTRPLPLTKGTPPLSAPAPTLQRRLSTTSAALFGLSYICPVVIISTFGVIAQQSQGATALAYLVATGAMILTASSYGRMAARYPEAGSAYTYVSRTTTPVIGLVVGWVLLLDYFFIPMVIALITAKAFEVLLPGISFRVWILLIAAFATGVNLLGIKVADRVNLTIMAAQLAAMAGLAIVCVRYLNGTPPHAAAAVSITTGSLAAMLGGAAIACYSFLGFDAVTTMSEETRDPTRSIPRATVIAAAAGGAIFIAISYLMARVHPSHVFQDVDNAGFEIVRMVAGPLFVTAFMVVLLISNVAAAMCAQAASSRLLFAMGRSRTLPARFFGYLHPRYRTPSYSIVLMGIVMLGGEGMNIETATSCVNFGAFSAFLAVNICVLIDHLSQRRQLSGGAGKVLVAAAGALASMGLLASLGRIALTVGFAWLAIGLTYIGVLTSAYRKPLPIVDMVTEGR